MRRRYVPVPSDAIINFLESKGFRRVHGLTNKRGFQLTEVVYERAHAENPAVKVRVFTSITDGRDKVRRCRADAIKVATVVAGRKTYGIGKFPRILRTGSTEKVLARMLERMRAAYKRGTEWIREQTIKDVMLA